MNIFRGRGRWLAAGLIGLVCALGTPAWSEGVLIRTQPSQNTAVEGFDGLVKLWFSGNVSPRTPTLIVVDHQGQRVDNNDMRLVIDQRSELSVTTRMLKPGGYVVRYRVLTRDGLVVSGIYRFSVNS
jgi:methionine-rich copper-binding protein CopC